MKLRSILVAKLLVGRTLKIRKVWMLLLSIRSLVVLGTIFLSVLVATHRPKSLSGNIRRDYKVFGA